MEDLTKPCCACKLIKNKSEFHKLATSKDGYSKKCKICTRIYTQKNIKKRALTAKKYYENNLNKIAKKRKTYRINNIAKFNKIQDEHKEYHKKYGKGYWKSEKGKAVSKNNAHKRRVIISQGTVTTNQILKLHEEATHCYWCRKLLVKSSKAELEHYEPLSKGGQHIIENLTISCKKCNGSKKAKDPIVYANSIGRLL